MSDKEKPVHTLKDLKRLLQSSDAKTVETSASIQPRATDVTPQTTNPSAEPADLAPPTEFKEEAADGPSSIDRENLAFLDRKLADAERREREAANLETRLRRLEIKLDKRQARLDARALSLAAERDDLRAEKAKLRADEERLADVAVEERRLAQNVKAFEARDAKLKKAETAVKNKQAAARKLRADLRAALEENDTLSRQLRSANRKVAKLGREAETYAESLRAIEHAEHLADWMLGHASSEQSVPWSTAVVLGSGPLDETEFWNFLIDRGVDVYEPNTEDVPVMIVGRDGWTEEQLEMQIAAQQGDTLRVYSQEMALVALASGSDIFDVADEDDLRALAGDHPALEVLKEGELQWPLFTVVAIPSEFRPFDFEDRAVDKSPLKELDYTVGITKGLPVKERTAILTEAFLGRLPRVHSDEYMRDWGRPRTRRRLWRMANHLAWLARSSRHMPSHAYAVSDWATDLAMLEKKFFKPWMRFKWPKVTVPGPRRRR